MLIAGFTGTRVGMTVKQCDAVWDMIAKVDVLKHGDCIGADADAHAIAVQLGKTVEIHPPDNPKLRAGMHSEKKFPPKPYRERNRDIVDGCRVLIATPKSTKEEPYSGTWTTIRYAVEQGKPVRIVFPDGTVEKR